MNNIPQQQTRRAPISFEGYYSVNKLVYPYGHGSAHGATVPMMSEKINEDKYLGGGGDTRAHAHERGLPRRLWVSRDRLFNYIYV